MRIFQAVVALSITGLGLPLTACTIVHDFTLPGRLPADGGMAEPDEDEDLPENMTAGIGGVGGGTGGGPGAAPGGTGGDMVTNPMSGNSNLPKPDFATKDLCNDDGSLVNADAALGLTVITEQEVLGAPLQANSEHVWLTREVDGEVDLVRVQQADGAVQRVALLTLPSNLLATDHQIFWIERFMERWDRVRYVGLGETDSTGLLAKGESGQVSCIAVDLDSLYYGVPEQNMVLRASLNQAFYTESHAPGSQAKVLRPFEGALYVLDERSMSVMRSHPIDGYTILAERYADPSLAVNEHGVFFIPTDDTLVSVPHLGATPPKTWVSAPPGSGPIRHVSIAGDELFWHQGNGACTDVHRLNVVTNEHAVYALPSPSGPLVTRGSLYFSVISRGTTPSRSQLIRVAL